jgi:hypothetical protein
MGWSRTEITSSLTTFKIAIATDARPIFLPYVKIVPWFDEILKHPGSGCKVWERVKSYDQS